MKKVWSAVSYLLLICFALLLLAKISLWLNLDWLAAYRGKIDQLLVMFAGICGIFTGAMGRTFLHLLSLLAGIFLVLEFFLPSFPYMEVVSAAALIIVLVAAIFCDVRAGKGARRR